jgi:hypothetical protein
LSARTLDRRFESPSGHECMPLVSLRCVALCRYRPCDGLNARPGRPNVCPKTDQGNKAKGGVVMEAQVRTWTVALCKKKKNCMALYSICTRFESISCSQITCLVFPPFLSDTPSEFRGIYPNRLQPSISVIPFEFY